MLPAIPVLVIHMLPPGLIEIEMPIALLAEMVILALYVVLLQSLIALKVEITVITGPVRVGIFHMLLEGAIVRKPSITPVTVCHDCGSPKKKGVGSCVEVGRGTRVISGIM